MKVEVVFVIL